MTEIERLTGRIRAHLTLLEVEAQAKHPDKPDFALMMEALQIVSAKTAELRAEIIRQNANT